MSKEEFLDRLEYLLSDLPEEETEDALDEAGDAAEEAVREFGSPERIASIIRSELQGGFKSGGELTDTGYADERFRDPNCMLARREEEAERQPGGAGTFDYGNREGASGVDSGGTGGFAGSGGGTGGFAGVAGGTGGSAGGSGGAAGDSGVAAGGNGGNGGNAGRPGANTATKVLWIILAAAVAIAVLPALLGLAGGAFGIVVGVLAVLLVFFLLTAILTIVFLAAGAAVTAAGIAAAFSDPVSGVMCAGAGLVLLALGLVGVALSVLVYGKLMPWLFRGALDGVSGMLHGRRRTA